MSKDYKQVIVDELLLAIDLYEESINYLDEISYYKHREDYEYWTAQSHAALAKIYSFRNMLKNNE